MESDISALSPNPKSANDQDRRAPAPGPAEGTYGNSRIPVIPGTGARRDRCLVPSRAECSPESTVLTELR